MEFPKEQVHILFFPLKLVTSVLLSQKIQRGQKENAMKCKNNGGNTPFGYYVDKKKTRAGARV